MWPKNILFGKFGKKKNLFCVQKRKKLKIINPKNIK